MPSTRSLAFAVLAALTLSSPSARAEDIVRARKAFAEGVRLYRNGDWEGARRLFREADTEHHASTIVYNIGLAEEKLGHPQAAVDAYEAYLAESGESGEFAAAAAAAMAQLKARSTRLRLETTPPGARLFVDATPLTDRAPASFLVPPGHHVVAAEGEGWRAERTVETLGAGDTLAVLLAPAPAPAPASSTSPPASPLPPAHDLVSSPPPPRDDAPEELTWGAAFAMVPIYLLGVTTPNATNARPGASIVAGPLLEGGWALTDRFELLGRGFAGIGPDAKPSTGWWLGPGLSYRVGSAVWVGASFIGGDISTRAHSEPYGTSFVFGGMLEANVVLLQKRGGEWLAGIQPSVLLTQIKQDNTALFFPVTFGYRSY